MINSFIDEFGHAENQKDLATCDLMGWFEAEVNGQKSFESLFNIKIGHKNKRESIEKREAHILVTESIKKLVIYLNSIILFSEDETAWNDIFSNIEGIVKQATTISRSRRSVHVENSID